MNRSRQRPRRSRRFVAVFATLVVFGALITITQVSAANDRDGNRGACPTPTGPSPGGGTPSPTGEASPAAHDHGDATLPPAEADAQAEAASEQAADATRSRDGSRRDCQPTASPTTGTAAPAPTTAPPASLEVLGTNCDDSQMEPHDGFQLGNRCVSTAFGEVGEAANNPTLLISQSPLRVRVNRPFTIQVSTRNLVRDRFLPAKDGGYYRESAYLNEDGLVRGHFHTACRMLTGRRAPDPVPVPVFFQATEDGNGGSEPDVVTVSIPGLASTGMAQCAAWAGDGSHRVPMMQRANQIPAFDSVRIIVTR